MTTPLRGTAVDRRSVVRGIGGLAVVGTLAGCSSDGGEANGNGSVSVDEWLSDTSNYDGVVDHTGEDEVTVAVGVQANGGAFGFGPAAIRVDEGTTVVWEWTGEGSTHNVVHDGGEFESEFTNEAGHTFDHTFGSSGTYRYLCAPHEGLGMRGTVVVE